MVWGLGQCSEACMPMRPSPSPSPKYHTVITLESESEGCNPQFRVGVEGFQVSAFGFKLQGSIRPKGFLASVIRVGPPEPFQPNPNKRSSRPGWRAGVFVDHLGPKGLLVFGQPSHPSWLRGLGGSFWASKSLDQASGFQADGHCIRVKPSL